jgi:hypothetical protein
MITIIITFYNSGGLAQAAFQKMMRIRKARLGRRVVRQAAGSLVNSTSAEGG